MIRSRIRQNAGERPQSICSRIRQNAGERTPRILANAATIYCSAIYETVIQDLPMNWPTSQDYNEAIRLKPDHARAFFGRGEARREKGDLARLSRAP